MKLWGKVRKILRLRPKNIKNYKNVNIVAWMYEVQSYHNILTNIADTLSLKKKGF